MRKVSLGCFPYTLSVHITMSCVHTLDVGSSACATYISVHYDYKWDERMFAVFVGASAQPEKS